MSAAALNTTQVFLNISGFSIFAGGTIGTLLFMRVHEVAKSHFSFLNRMSTAEIGIVGACFGACVGYLLPSRYYALTFIIVGVAFLSLFGVKTKGVEDLPDFVTDMTQDALESQSTKYEGIDQYIQDLSIALTMKGDTSRSTILVGSAGCGKTATVKEFARRLAVGEVCPKLKNKRLYSIDLAKLLQGSSIFDGAAALGETETKINKFKQFAKSNPNALFFLDEAHTIVGAGVGAKGTASIADHLKSIVAEGSLSIIAATTTEEYVRYFSRDPALARRFPKIIVTDPNILSALKMLSSRRQYLAQGTTITTDALRMAVFCTTISDSPNQLLAKPVQLISAAVAVATIEQREDEKISVQIGPKEVVERFIRSDKRYTEEMVMTQFESLQNGSSSYFSQCSEENRELLTQFFAWTPTS